MNPDSKPDPYSSHVWIPVADPEPFNALVAENESPWGPEKGVVIHGQSRSTAHLVFETDFSLIGYEPHQNPVCPLDVPSLCSTSASVTTVRGNSQSTEWTATSMAAAARL
jgi:hypothetical protein